MGKGGSERIFAVFALIGAFGVLILVLEFGSTLTRFSQNPTGDRFVESMWSFVPSGIELILPSTLFILLIVLAAFVRKLSA